MIEKHDEKKNHNPYLKHEPITRVRRVIRAAICINERERNPISYMYGHPPPRVYKTNNIIIVVILLRPRKQYVTTLSETKPPAGYRCV